MPEKEPGPVPTTSDVSADGATSSAASPAMSSATQAGARGSAAPKGRAARGSPSRYRAQEPGATDRSTASM